MNIDDFMRKEIEERMVNTLKYSFTIYGIEGTEQIIKEVYTHAPTLRNKYLELYSKLLKK